MIFGHLNQTISGCYEKIPFGATKSDAAFGFVYRRDPETNESIFEKMNINVSIQYQALVFVTDRLSSPDVWIM